MKVCIDHGFSTGTTKRGYKRVSHNGVQTYLHRVVLAQYLGVDERLLDTVMHSCDNPRCVQPAHLSNGTHSANMQDMLHKNRQAQGERHGRSKLSDIACTYIRENWKFRDPEFGTTAMANKFGVTSGAISDMLHHSSRGM